MALRAATVTAVPTRGVDTAPRTIRTLDKSAMGVFVSQDHPLDRYVGSWALVTGSAGERGLGFAYAREIASRRVNLVLVDILAEELEARATALRTEYGVEVRTIAADLGDLSVYPKIVDQLADVTVDVLVCNHMYTPKDTPKILDMALEVHNAMIDINARAYVNLIYPFAHQMTKRGRGAIVIVSSGAGLIPAPYTGAYAANKAFQIVFGEVLWYETRDTGVDVLVMSAGLMDTQGDALSKYPRWQIADPRDAAAETLRAIGRKHLVMPGRPNRLVTLLSTRLMPRRRAVLTMGRFMERGLGKDPG
ncbi:SDR family NAD(P)-dependent oxidoreductase [Mycobacterium genavense]|uniref:SDR family NAD(P)-dependent oxidoreductase n=1 Tax=Mycobacterium genavense TaxID=36812 RepID=UPI000A001EDC|nr:SDR family NAD(P)-dependent oxidoreductase [Mycobacterium genavense]